MRPWLLFLLLVPLAVPAVTAHAESDDRPPELRFCPESYRGERSLDQAHDLLHDYAKKNASRYPRPTEGPCKGERIDRPEHCIAAIIGKLRAGDARGAAEDLRDRVRNRTKPDLRTNFVFSKVLERLRRESVSPDPSTIIEAGEALARTVEADDCKTSIGLLVVRHWLRLREPAWARLAFERTIEPSEPKKTEYCIFGEGSYYAVHAALVVDRPVDSEEPVLFLSASTLLAILGDAGDSRLNQRLVSLAMSAKWRPKDPAALCLLASAARDANNIPLTEALTSRAFSAHGESADSGN